MKTIEFYFDFTSPYSYLVWEEFLSNKEYWFNKVDFKIIPIMVGKVFSLIESTGPGEVKSKREYLFKDVLRRAHKKGLDLRSPAQMPFNPLPLLRMVESLGDNKELQRNFITKTFYYGWKLGRDYEDFNGFRDYITKECDISVSDYMLLEENKESRRSLKKNIKFSVEAGVFGVPSMISQGELFWGLDSLEYLRAMVESSDTLYPKNEYERFIQILKGDKSD